jgi:hypothetical protein
MEKKQMRSASQLDFVKSRTRQAKKNWIGVDTAT